MGIAKIRPVFTSKLCHFRLTKSHETVQCSSCWTIHTLAEHEVLTSLLFQRIVYVHVRVIPTLLSSSLLKCHPIIAQVSFLMELTWIKRFLGAFVNPRKITVSFVMSVMFVYLSAACLTVCLSVRMEKFNCHWTNFHEIWYLNIFRKSVEKIEVLLRYYKNNRYFTRRCM
jgi:hypothetical protein